MAVFLGAFVLTAIAFKVYLTWKMKKPVGPVAPKGFPVVVFWRDPGAPGLSARVFPAEEVPAFQKARTGTTFLLPDGVRPEMERELLRQAEGIDDEISKRYSTGRYTYVWAQVIGQGPGWQDWRVRLQHGNEHVNVGYYRAYADRFEPRYLERYFGPGTALDGCPFMLLMWGGLSWIFSVSLKRIPYFDPAKAARAAG